MILKSHDVPNSVILVRQLIQNTYLIPQMFGGYRAKQMFSSHFGTSSTQNSQG